MNVPVDTQRFFISFRTINGKDVMAIFDTETEREVLIRDSAVDYNSILVGIAHVMNESEFD